MGRPRLTEPTGNLITKPFKVRGPGGRPIRKLRHGYRIAYPDPVTGIRRREPVIKWSTAEEAAAAMATRIAELKRGQVDNPDKTTLGTLVERFLDFKTREGKRSLRTYRDICSSHILPHFGPDTAMGAITTGAIARWNDTLTGPVSAYRRANVVSMLRNLFNWAHRSEYVRAVPAFPKITKPSVPKERILVGDEGKRLGDACRRSRNPYLYLIVLVALATGLRLRNVMEVRWELFDLERRRITIERTKRQKVHHLDMTTDLYEALVAHQPDPRQRTGLLFHKEHNKDLAYGSIRTAWETACRRANLTDINFHTLRHTFASYYMMNSTDEKALYNLAEILDHSDIKLTRRYAHYAPSYLKKAMRVMDGFATRMLNGPAIPDTPEALLREADGSFGRHFGGNRQLPTGSDDVTT